MALGMWTKIGILSHGSGKKAKGAFSSSGEIGFPWKLVPGFLIPRSSRCISQQFWFFLVFPLCPRWSEFCRFSWWRIFLVLICSVPSELPAFSSLHHLSSELPFCLLVGFCLKALPVLRHFVKKKKKSSQINLLKHLLIICQLTLFWSLLPAMPDVVLGSGFGDKGHGHLLS